MSKLSQREAVFSTVMNVLAEAGVKFEDGMVAKDILTKEQRAQVNTILFHAFKAQEIELSGEKTDSDLKSYVSGLQSNWLNKDTRLNGGMKYVPKNPGSRAGIQDPQIKALKALLSTKTDADEIAEINGYITKRQAELNVVKAKQVTIDFSVLPEALRTKFSAE